MCSQDRNSLPLPPSRSQSNLPELCGLPAQWDTNLICFLHSNVRVKCASERWEGSCWKMVSLMLKTLILWHGSFWEKCIGSDKKTTLVQDEISDELEGETCPSCTSSEGNTLVGLFWYLLRASQIWTLSDFLVILKDVLPQLCEEDLCPGPEEPSQ